MFGNMQGGGLATAGQNPQQKYLIGGGLGDYFRNNSGALSTLAAGLIGGDRDTLANAVAAMPQAQAMDRQRADKAKQNAAIQNWLWSASNGMSAEQAALAQAFPQLAAQQALAGPETTNDIINWQFSQKNPAFADAQRRAATMNAPGYGLTPVWGTDADGNTVLMQLGKGGQAVQSALPEGVTPMSPGQLNAARASGTAVGKGQGEASVNLPSAEHNAQRMLYDIDQALNAPGLNSVVGPIQGRIQESLQFNPQSIEALSRINKLKADTFVQAFESLKGAGQITEFESQSAANALSRLNDRALSDADYRQALLEFKTEVEKLLALARTKAGGAGSAGWSDLGNGVRIRVKE